MIPEYFLALTIIATLVPSFSDGASLGTLERVKRQSFQIPRAFQSVNVENYLKNPRAMKFQLNCVVYDGPCDTIGKLLKSNLRKWMHTQCKNCDETTRKQAAKILTFFQENYSQEWNDAIKKYKGNFTDAEIKKFEKELGINIVVVVPTGPPKKPDLNALAALARETIEVAKTVKTLPVFESRGPSGKTVTHVVTVPPNVQLPPQAQQLLSKYLPGLNATELLQQARSKQHELLTETVTKANTTTTDETTKAITTIVDATTKVTTANVGSTTKAPTTTSGATTKATMTTSETSTYITSTGAVSMVESETLIADEETTTFMTLSG